MKLEEKLGMATVHYTGTLDDGTEFDSSRGREPLSFRLGCSEVIKGFEEAVQGLTPGQNVKVVIPADEAYGPRREDMVVSIPRGQYPDGMPQELGTTIGLRTPDGMEIPATIVEFSDENVILDANHPLAGERLTFDIELVSLEN